MSSRSVGAKVPAREGSPNGRLDEKGVAARGEEELTVIEEEGVMALIGIGVRAVDDGRGRARRGGGQREMVFGVTPPDMADIARVDVHAILVFQTGSDPGIEGLARVSAIPAIILEVVPDNAARVILFPVVVIAPYVEMGIMEEKVAEVDIRVLPVPQGVSEELWFIVQFQEKPLPGGFILMGGIALSGWVFCPNLQINKFVYFW